MDRRDREPPREVDRGDDRGQGGRGVAARRRSLRRSPLGGGQQSYDVFRANLERVGAAAQVEVYRGLSEQAASSWDGKPVGLLYVDGAHDRRSVLIDIDRWEPYVADGGLVCFHDAYSSVGVTLALLQRHALNGHFRYGGATGSLVPYRRQQMNGMQRALSAARQAARIGWFMRNLAVKVALRRGWERVPRLLGHHGRTFPY
jgi:hypothetical protein